MDYSPQSGETVTRKASSDMRLVESIWCAVNDSRLRAWSGQLQIEVHNGCVTLGGTLPSFYLKQVLQTIVIQLPGVGTVHNRVQVNHDL